MKDPVESVRWAVRRRAAFGLALAALCFGAVVDRLAVSVGDNAITLSDAIEEIGVTAFENGTKPNFSPEARRAAAERLVDQGLLLKEMTLTNFQGSGPAAADKLLSQLVAERFGGSTAELEQALKQYGLTEDELKKHLERQASILAFTQSRFGSDAPTPNAALEKRAGEAAVVPNFPSPEQQMDAWLKEARGNTRIVFHKEAFE